MWIKLTIPRKVFFLIKLYVTMNKGFHQLSLLFFILLLMGCAGQVAEEQAEPGTWVPNSKLLAQKDKLFELNLSDQGYTTLSDQLGEFTQLEKLNLKGNKLWDLPPVLGNLKNVRRLNLAKNELKELPAVVLEMTGIKELDLRHNKLEKLPEEIKKLSKLHTIYIGNNYFSDIQRVTIREWLPKTKVIISNE